MTTGRINQVGTDQLAFGKHAFQHVEFCASYLTQRLSWTLSNSTNFFFSDRTSRTKNQERRSYFCSFWNGNSDDSFDEHYLLLPLFYLKVGTFAWARARLFYFIEFSPATRIPWKASRMGTRGWPQYIPVFVTKGKLKWPNDCSRPLRTFKTKAGSVLLGLFSLSLSTFPIPNNETELRTCASALAKSASQKLLALISFSWNNYLSWVMKGKERRET